MLLLDSFAPHGKIHGYFEENCMKMFRRIVEGMFNMHILIYFLCIEQIYIYIYYRE